MALRDEVAVKVIVGLGNPGSSYARSRHNVGFLVSDRLARSASWIRRDCWEEVRTTVGARDVWLVRPLTYMNRSGVAVSAVAAERELLPAEILVVSDDVTLPWGRLRIRKRGSAGGHRGLVSIEDRLQTVEYPRLRVGVSGPPQEHAMEDYVLEPLEGAEWDRLRTAVDRSVEAVDVICREGVEAAMNRFNGTPPEPAASDDGGDGREA